MILFDGVFVIQEMEMKIICNFLRPDANVEEYQLKNCVKNNKDESKKYMI